MISMLDINEEGIMKLSEVIGLLDSQIEIAEKLLKSSYIQLEREEQVDQIIVMAELSKKIIMKYQDQE